MSYGTIYKITNIKTGKVYIGKTTRSLNDRLQGHINSADRGDNFKLSRAMVLKMACMGNTILQKQKKE